MSPFPENLTLIRKILGYNQEGFATLLSKKRHNIGSYEEGRSEPRLVFMLALSKMTNISINDLYEKKLTLDDINTQLKLKEARETGNLDVTEASVFYGSSDLRSNIQLLEQQIGHLKNELGLKDKILQDKELIINLLQSKPEAT